MHPAGDGDRAPQIEAGGLDMEDVIRPIYEEASKAVGRKFEYPTKK